MDRSLAGASPRAGRGYQFTTCAIVFVLSLFVIVFLQQRAGSRRAELSGFQESAHYVTGLMVRGYVLHGRRLTAPVPFAENYYFSHSGVFWENTRCPIMPICMDPKSGEITSATGIVLVTDWWDISSRGSY